MGRKRSNYVCVRCGDYGFKRTNPDAVVHYDSKTGKRRTCYYKHYIESVPPKKFWGHSPLYDKLGDVIDHFETIIYKLKKIRSTVYKYPPKDEVSSKCVTHLDMWDKHVLTPLEKLLTPYIDERWGQNWTMWFKTQMDRFEHGSRAAGIMNAIETGELIMELSKDENSVIELPIEKEFTSKQVKTNGKKILSMARDVLKKDELVSALDEWSNHTEFEVELNDPEEFYRKEMTKKQKGKTKI